ncbi:MAG: rRNA pseudouridine synthase [Acidobacteriota bacterium]|nr:rRNA pseudouridine synthase [Acidobacteriota bacterium]
MNSKPSMTLDRVLSRFGLASRGEALAAIERGRLKVNGRVIRDPEFWVRPDEDAIQLDGLRLKRAPGIYLLFYKPKGVITSHGDPEGRKTVYDFFGELAKWVAPAGRLDRDSSGLLIMTNDTDFASRVTSPASSLPKTYLVKTSGLMPDETIAALASGVRMKRGDWARPLSVRRREDRGKYTWLDVTLTEGKNREVRRMIEAVGFKVLKLVRIAIGPLKLEGLEPGRWRRLTTPEVKAIRRLCAD